MNYFTWSQEYYRDAENLLKTIRKYERILKEGKVHNLELINSILSNYRNIYYEMINTGKLLEARGIDQEQSNAA